MKRIYYIFATVLLICTSCTKDNLKYSGLIGLWEIESKPNNLDNSSQKFCCKYLELFLDTNTDDLKGKYIVYNAEDKISGEFQIDNTHQFIDFRSKSETTKYQFSIDYIDKSLSLLKKDSIIYERWIKVN